VPGRVSVPAILVLVLEFMRGCIVDRVRSTKLRSTAVPPPPLYTCVLIKQTGHQHKDQRGDSVLEVLPVTEP